MIMKYLSTAIAAASLVVCATVNAQTTAENAPTTGSLTITGATVNFVKDSFNFTTSTGVFIAYDDGGTTFGALAANASGTKRLFGAGSNSSLTRCTEDTRDETTESTEASPEYVANVGSDSEPLNATGDLTGMTFPTVLAAAGC